MEKLTFNIITEYRPESYTGNPSIVIHCKKSEKDTEQLLRWFLMGHNENLSGFEFIEVT